MLTAPLMEVEKRETKQFPGLGEKIKQARIRHSDSVTKLAANAGISAAYWYQVEKEEVKSLPLERVRKIEAALGENLGVSFDD